METMSARDGQRSLTSLVEKLLTDRLKRKGYGRAHMKERRAADRKIWRTSAERVLSANRTRWTKAELGDRPIYCAADSPEIQTQAEAIRRLVERG